MRLPSSVCECAVVASVSALEFFARPDRIKKLWHYPTRYRYVSTRDKQAFCLLTADMLEGMPLPGGGADGHGLGQQRQPAQIRCWAAPGSFRINIQDWTEFKTSLSVSKLKALI